MQTRPRIPTPVRRAPRRRRPDTGPLRRAPAFARADPRALAELAPHADVVHLPPGRPLVVAGTAARELIVVLAGEVAVLGADGGRVVLGAGAEIGGAELLAGARHEATAVASSAVEALVVNGPAARWAYAEGVAQPAPTGSTGPVAPPSPPRPRGVPVAV